MSVTPHTHALRPTRGLVATINRRGKRYRPESIRRWLRLNRVVFKADKVDILIGADGTDPCMGYLAEAERLGLRVSLRTSCHSFLPDLNRLRSEGLLDVFLTPTSIDQAELQDWLTAAHEAQLPVRLQIPMVYPTGFNPDDYAQHLAQHSVKVVNITAHDSFQDELSTEATSFTTTQVFITALEAYSIEVNILHLPFCQVDESLWPNIVNEPQFFASHQHYLNSAYTLAEKLFGKGPSTTSIVLQMLLRKHTLMNDPIDNKLLPWLMGSPWLRARAVAWHRLTRHLRLTRAVPKPLSIESEEHAERILKAKADELHKMLRYTCGPCRLRAVCNHDTHPGAKRLTNKQCFTVEGELVTSPLHFSSQRNIYCDEIDEARYALPERMESLASAARTVIENFPPTQEIDSFDYSTAGQWSHQLPGGVRWYGFTNSEKQSTVLATLNTPFTLSYVVGGGIAEYAGFSLGRECTLVCPMETFQHTITLHVAENGDYVFLRDGLPVPPVQFEGHGSVPIRLGTPLSPRISLWNIDQSLVTQNVKLWHEAPNSSALPENFRYSIITVCVRYARRLQLMLQSIAHQTDTDLSEIEIIVAHVPDVDATEDVLESIAQEHPELTIRRVTLSEDNAMAKGLIINNCVDRAQGDWVILLDADTLLPPTFLHTLEQHTDDAQFIVPDGRKLLSPATTAKLLLGNISPWNDWDSLLNSKGEMRFREMDGVPIGYCQIVRRDCFDQVRYYEADHFEGADWQFSIEMRKVFGEETRLSGVPLLHLDHGGSKWYGTKRHY